MFDFTRLSEQLTSWIGGEAAADGVPGSDVLATITAAGIDLEALQGLPADEIMSTLAADGIDLSAFTGDQIGELLRSLGADAGNG